MTDEEYQMKINREFDHRELKVKACIALAYLFGVAALAVYCRSAFGAPPDTTFALSTEVGESPASTTITWNCKGATATALSTANQPAWSGNVALSGTKKLSGIRIPSMYGIKCDSASSPSGFTVSWEMPMLNKDGSELKDLLAFEVSYGSSLPEQRPTRVRVPVPTAREVFIEAPPGDYFVAVQAVATRGLGYESNIIQKTAVATLGESTTITKNIDVYTLPAAPVIK